ncbi:general stress protein [Rummeliibacillus sp. G93]|uniref:General stress protein n=1 Tax=Rummeliibacillus stabekisii TaxID=241244 RepID=A0A143HGH1_9BACL|nr:MULTISPECIES: general stress protein [Rummeliibacillus]AMX00829.1 general stress protein [Rummeliibacillus stabekisii]MBB5170576.1 tRNA A37 N6-isopentenylltransferase MiaA [Rummeliibacillus stabekisii]MCM3315146.1 general stress protein [Rummeliibacillus stabekisii]UQW97678.1 general stress protein [Rummeliibacillus sp. G93]GEL04830.1 general stress protein [Rummeliibacillus stabekisii]
MVTKITVENAVQAKEEIEKLEAQGYSRDDVYVFAHYQEREDDIADALDTAEVGMKEQGFFKSMKNLVAKRGDELRTEMQAVGLSEAEADAGEKELDQGKLVLVVNKK